MSEITCLVHNSQDCLGCTRGMNEEIACLEKDLAHMTDMFSQMEISLTKRLEEAEARLTEAQESINFWMSAKDKVESRLSALESENKNLRDAFTRIVVHGCGCNPTCECEGEGSLKIWKEEVKSIAKEALTEGTWTERTNLPPQKCICGKPQEECKEGLELSRKIEDSIFTDGTEEGKRA